MERHRYTWRRVVEGAMMRDREDSAWGFKIALYALAMFALLALATGCSDRFRYACQDPKNWKNEECVRPTCAVNGVCPDQLIRASDMKAEREP